MKLRSLDYSDADIADQLGFSISTYYRRIRVLKKKYDNLRIYHSELPERLTIKETAFNVFNQDEALEFVNNTSFDEYIIEIKFKKEVKKNNP